MRRVKRHLARAAAIMTVAAGGIAVMASPAQAAYAACTIILTPWRTTCTTSAIPPNPTYHFVDWRVVSSTCSASYRLVDKGNGVWVASGTVATGATKTGGVWGLYSPAGYYLVVETCYAGGGSIENVL